MILNDQGSQYQEKGHRLMKVFIIFTKVLKICLKVVRSTFLPNFETEHNVVMCRSHTITPVQAYTGKILKTWKIISWSAVICSYKITVWFLTSREPTFSIYIEQFILCSFLVLVDYGISCTRRPVVESGPKNCACCHPDIFYNIPVPVCRCSYRGELFCYTVDI